MLAKPSWVKVKAPDQGALDRMQQITKEAGVHTICESAVCPNVSHCFSEGTATFLIMGNTCTRSCGFCAVDKGAVSPLDSREPLKVAGVVNRLGLKYVVITSVTRDDLPHGGADHYARVVTEIRHQNPETCIEVLLPDFKGSREAYNIIVDASPEVYGHNIETVPRLYAKIRPKANYESSLEMLDYMKRKGRGFVKTNLLLGMGEEKDEVLNVLKDLRKVKCHIITFGQYLRPSHRQLPVSRYITPQEFQELEEEAVKMGFHAAAGTFVRSSFKAMQTYTALSDKCKGC